MAGGGLPDDRRKRAYWVGESVGDIGQTEARFDVWARHYDADVAGLFGWQPPLEAAAASERYLAKDARILDAGCGTGLVGEALAARGYRDVAAADLSQAMLDVARGKGVYREFFKLDLTEPLGFPDDSFDGLLCIGTSAWMTGEPYAEFARVVRPHGIIVCAIGDARFREGRFEAVIQDLAGQGALEVVEVGQAFRTFPRSDLPDEVRVRVFRVLP